jgi:hypothetical protein
MMKKPGKSQLERKRNSSPPSPSKGKSIIHSEDEPESSKNKFDPLETLDPELISSKENSEETTRDHDVVIELQPEEPDPQHQGSHQVP